MSSHAMPDMTLERLHHLVAAYGAEPRHWPDVERPAAEALVARSSAARDLLAQARELDAVLAAVPADVPDAAMARLTAATAFPPSQRNSLATTGLSGGWLTNLASAFWPRATVFTAMAVLGIITGLAIEPVYSGSDAYAMVVSDPMSDMDEDLGL